MAFFGINAVAQNLSNSEFLIEYLGQEKFDQMSNVNPSYLEFLDAKCEHGYEITAMGAEKTAGFTVLNQIEVRDPNKNSSPTTISVAEFIALDQQDELNILMYQITSDRSAMTYYVLGTTGKVLMLYPAEYIAEKQNSK